MRNYLLTLFFILSFTNIFCDAPIDNYTYYGKSPTWEMNNYDGSLLSSSSYKNEVVLFIFWSSTCGYSRIIIPYLIELQDELGPQGVQMIGFSTDTNESDFITYKNSVGLNFPTGLKHFAQNVFDTYVKIEEVVGAIDFIPTIVICNSSFLMVCRIDTTPTKEFLRQSLQISIINPSSKRLG